MKHEQKYACPYCGREFDITVYDSVNAQDQDLRDRTVSGDLFRHCCPHCHTDFMVQNKMLYSDSQNKFVILLSDEPMPESQRALGEALVKQGYTLRRVDTIAGLVEKISVFEDGVSDILAELGKYDSFIEYLDNHQGKAESVTSIEYQKTENDVMKINIRFDDRGMSFHIPVAMLEEELKPQEGLYHIDEASFPVVDSDTIIGMFLKEGA